MQKKKASKRYEDNKLKGNYSKYKNHGNAEQKRDNKSDYEYLRPRDGVDRKRGSSR